MVTNELGVGLIRIHGFGEACEDVSIRQGRYSIGCYLARFKSNSQGRTEMSMLSSYIKRKVKKHGAKGFIIIILDIIVKMTPSKEDDRMVAKIKKAMDSFK